MPCLSLSAAHDSLWQSVKVGYFLYNDNNPIDNALNGFEDRRRDDFGLTFSIGFQISAELNLFPKATTQIQYTGQSALYSKDLNSGTTLPQGHPLYEDYEYLLDKHPDWNGLHLINQTCYSKSIKELSLVNQYENFTVGLHLRHAVIDAGEEQNMADLQLNYHKLWNSRSYYHQPFTDSTLFKGQRVSYFSFAPALGYSKVLHDKRWFVQSGIAAKLWYNTTDEFQIPQFSPEMNAQLDLGYGKNMGPRQRKYMLRYALTYEPNEIVQRFADPGTVGFQYLGLELNFRSKNRKQRPFFFQYSLRPYEVFLPLGKQNDPTLGYEPPSRDLRMIEGIMNLSVALRFNAN